MVTKNAESDVEKLAHDSAANGQVMEFALLKDSDPGLERSTPAPGGCGRHIEGFAQEGITDFGKVGLAIAGTPGTTFCRTQPGIGSQLPCRSEFFTS